jgi:DNA (cytosine-5)-methyltransferase 1
LDTVLDQLNLGLAGQPSDALQIALAHRTKKEVADRLGYSGKQITRWLKGETPVPHAVIPALESIGHPKPAMPPSGDSFTFIDLFAGIGGIRLGFEQAGGRCIFTSEWDEYAQRTYQENFGDDHPIHGDITKVPMEAVPEHDVLVGGFPCQPFSIAGVSKKNALGRPHGFECTTQGTLFFDVARIIEARRPKGFLLENVKNLASHDGGNTLRVIRDVLEQELDYHVTIRVVDGQRFVPQHRERILIVGIRKDVGPKFDFDTVDLPDLGAGPRMASILHGHNRLEPAHDGDRFVGADRKARSKYVLTPKLWQYLQDYAAKHKAAGNGFGYGLVGPEDVARTLSARYYKDGSEILVKNGNGNPRRLTPRECARLMGFPEEFRIVVSDTRAYKQFGNSVVVPLMSAMAKAIRPIVCGEAVAAPAAGGHSAAA